MIECGSEICSDFLQSGGREWLETNGLGGFACSTISGMNTRRYHGLLTAATQPPGGRLLLLSKLEETLVIGVERFDLSTNQYVGAIHPRGFELLSNFRLDPFPLSTFEVAGVRIQRTAFMVHGSNTTVIKYNILKAPRKISIRLEIRPLIAFRDYHSTTHENDVLDPTVYQEKGLASVSPYAGLPRLYLAHTATDIETQATWYRQFFYAVEAERGLDAIEDLFNPMTLSFEISQKRTATIIASDAPCNVADASKFRRKEVARRSSIQSYFPVEDDLARQLSLAADQFLVRREKGPTVIAGYPWFTDWGRDTLIALPGLTLSPGNAVAARGALLTFAEHVDMGMIPNRFPDIGAVPEYNTVDATLWFFEAVVAYLAQTGDRALVRDKLYDVLTDIIEWHIRGTRYNIRMFENGLLHAGEPGVPLTWMDAKAGDLVVTPRMGFPVEIQALWYNALKIMEDLSARFDHTESAQRYHFLASVTQKTFNSVFWNSHENCLYDSLDNDNPDASIRPNQILAVSLRHSMLDSLRQANVLRIVEQRLLTPYGLRTLSQDDPNYKGRYEGDPFHRDAAYHQGTVWPWLLGPFITAYLRVHGSTVSSRKHARNLLRSLEERLQNGALGQVAEIYDGDAPQLPRGCFAQAWSVAEILRVLLGDIYPAKKKHMSGNTVKYV